MFTRQPASAAKTINDIRSIEKPLERPLETLRPGIGPGQMGPGQIGPSHSGPSEAAPFGHSTQATSAPSTKPAMPRSAGSRLEGTFSIIGNDLTIVGQGLRIVTRGTLQVEGKIEGDVIGNEVIIGDKGHVTGVVSGNTVVVHGAVAGTVKGVHVALKAGSRVDGDVLHQQLSVDQGAHLDGRVRRPADLAELAPVLE